MHEFPNLQWLKQQVKQNFANRRGPGNLRLETGGFPSVIIHTKTRQAYRPDITGPISLFVNLKGSSDCIIDGRRMQVTEDTYCISNRLQDYTLEINSNEPVETFNIHIGEHFSENFLHGLTHTSEELLNNVTEASAQPLNFYNKLYRRDAEFNRHVSALMQLQQPGVFNKMLFEEKLAGLMLHLLQQHTQVLAGIAKMPAVKAAVKQELYKRISMAADYIHATYTQNIQLEDMAAAACLSKFHFLRLFKQVYKVSPYQYIQQLRLEKAHQLLTTSQDGVNDIAATLGYENSNSFSRIFYQRTGLYPSQYRQKAN
jgi:AraC family transcriptional regulator